MRVARCVTSPICSNWRRSTSAGAGIELRLHQMRHQMNDVRLEAPVQKAAGRLQSEQPSANDGGASRRRGAAHDALAVVERAKHEHAVLEHAVLIAHVRRAAE